MPKFLDPIIYINDDSSEVNLITKIDNINEAITGIENLLNYHPSEQTNSNE